MSRGESGESFIKIHSSNALKQSRKSSGCNLGVLYMGNMSGGGQRVQTVSRRTAATLNLTSPHKLILMDFILFLLMKIPLSLSSVVIKHYSMILQSFFSQVTFKGNVHDRYIISSVTFSLHIDGILTAGLPFRSRKYSNATKQKLFWTFPS